jgi:hypothetical protein
MPSYQVEPDHPDHTDEQGPGFKYAHSNTHIPQWYSKGVLEHGVKAEDLLGVPIDIGDRSPPGSFHLTHREGSGYTGGMQRDSAWDADEGWDADEWVENMRKIPYLWHVSPSVNRESILKHGLVPQDPEWGGQPTGVYCEPDIGHLPIWGYGEKSYDIWKIPQSEVKELHYDGEGQALYIPHAVKPELHEPDADMTKYTRTSSDGTGVPEDSPYPPEFDTEKLDQIRQQMADEYGMGTLGTGCFGVAPEVEHHYPHAVAQSGEALGDGHMWNVLPDGGILDATWRRYVPAGHPDQADYVPYREGSLRESAMTTPQRLREWDRLSPPSLQTVHEFPDGWSVMQAGHPADVRAVGTALRNCWQSVGDNEGLVGPHMSLHDPHGLPRGAFVINDSNHISWPLGRNNRVLHPTLHNRLKEFAAAKGYSIGETPHHSSLRESMAADPNFVNDWIQRNGPYVYHGARAFGNDTPESVVQRIQQEGLKPDMRNPDNPHPGKPQNDDDWMMYDEYYLHPRPGHVFMTTTPEQAYGPHLFKVDLRKLDPAKINPDDDLLRDYSGSPATQYTGEFPEIEGPTGEPGEPTLGEQAEKLNFGSDPTHTERSFHYGVIAHQGPIPPEAIEYVPHEWPYNDTSNQVQAGVSRTARTFYHVAPSHLREKIRAEGLKGAEDVGGSPWDEQRQKWLNAENAVNQPSGVYLHDDINNAEAYAYALQGARGLRPYPGDDPDAIHEDHYGNPMDLYNEETDDYEPNPDYKPQGYDIWAVEGQGLPLQVDPEHRLLRGEMTAEEAQDDINRQVRNYGQPEMTEGHRWFVPQAVEPQRVQLHYTVPQSDMTENNFYDTLDSTKQIPEPWSAVPFDQWNEQAQQRYLSMAGDHRTMGDYYDENGFKQQKFPEEWHWPEAEGHVYHAAPVNKVDQIMQEGLIPQASDATKSYWPNARPYIHAHDNPDDLIDRFGDFLYQNHGPFELLKVPREHFKHYMGAPDEEMGARDDGSGREQFTWYAENPIPPEQIRRTGVVWPEPEQWVDQDRQ